MGLFADVLERFPGRGGKNSAKTYGGLILDSYNVTPVAKASADWLKTYGGHPWLHATVTRIAEGVAASPWEIVRGSGARRDQLPRNGIGLRKSMGGRGIGEHPVITLLNRPNPQCTGYQLRALTQVYIELTGEAFWLIDRDRAGTPVALWPIPPNWVESLPSTREPAFLLRLNGNPVEVPRSDMVWFKEINPYDPYGRGLGDAQAAADEVIADEYAGKHNVRWFYNGARPDVMMMLKGKLRNPGDAKRIKENWYSEYGGLWNSHKLAVVEGDVSEIKTLGTSPKDMEFSELRRTTRNAIIGAWGMSPSLVGIVEDVNRANADTGEYLFAKWIVYPRLIAFQDVVTADLLSQYPDSGDCWMEHTDPVPENRGQRNTEMQAALTSGAITINEYRASIGLPAAPGGNVYTLDKKYLVGRFPGATTTSSPDPATPASTALQDQIDLILYPEDDPNAHISN